MYFQSVAFGVFLAITLALYWRFANLRTPRYWLLLLASYVFYGAYEFWYLGLIVFSTLLDWYCGNAIFRADSKGRRKFFLGISLLGNLGVLCFFKYTDWVLDSIQMWLAAVGVEVDLQGAKFRILPESLMRGPAMRILVPVGISFYTFQTLSYTLDLYWQRIKPARNLLEFALFVAFFPQLVAGPIVRAIEFLPQLDIRPRLNADDLKEGFYRLGRGLFKKVVLADVIARSLVDPVYVQPESHGPLMHALAVYGFSFQVYNDFAGYSDCAIGTARLFGFRLPENFNLPYRSLGMREMWRRWHVSLSFWVRDYLYVPLGGSRRSEAVIARNLLISMLVIGVWHGASIHWVIYGLCMGGAQVFERWLERRRGGQPFATTPWRKFQAWFVVFNFWTFTTLFVRGHTLGDVQGVLLHHDIGVGAFGAPPTLGTAFAAASHVPLDLVWPAFLALAISIVTHFAPRRALVASERGILALPIPVLGLLFGALCGLIGYLLMGDVPFIYFAF